MSDRLKQRLLRRIRESGPISFAEFMEAALYDPNDGFYADHPVGDRGDFVTSPHVSSGFGALIEKMFFGMWWRLGRPKRFDVIEAGAGNGTLANSILDAARRDDSFDTQLVYSAVEISAGAKRDLERRGLPTFESLPEAPRVAAGCVLANELLDNLAFHRLRKREGKLLEVFLDADGEQLIEIEKAATVEGSCAEGEETTVCPRAIELVREAIATIERGWIVLFDYGHAGGEAPLPIRSYKEHRMSEDVYSDPGGSDITAGVDFDAIAKAAADEGASVFGPELQRNVLKSLGFDDWYSRLRASRLAAEEKRDTKAIIALAAEQSRAPLLIDEAHLGGLKVIAIATGIDAAPPGFD